MRLYNTRFQALRNFFRAIRRSPPLKGEDASRPMFSGRMMAQEYVSYAFFLVLRVSRRAVSDCRLLNSTEIHSLLYIETGVYTENALSVLYLQEVGKLYGKNRDISNLRKTFGEISNLGKTFDHRWHRNFGFLVWVLPCGVPGVSGTSE